MTKMVILPKILYKFQTIQPALLQTFFQTMILRCIWQGKKTRIQFSLLSRDKIHGGLAAPDIKRYYNAVIITLMIEWTNIKSEKRWVKLENTISKTLLSKII